jgi:hypothetical protein
MSSTSVQSSRNFVLDYAAQEGCAGGALIGICGGVVGAFLLAVVLFYTTQNMTVSLGVGFGAWVGVVAAGPIIGVVVAKVRQHLNEKTSPSPSRSMEDEYQKL